MRASRSYVCLPVESDGRVPRRRLSFDIDRVASAPGCERERERERCAARFRQMVKIALSDGDGRAQRHLGSSLSQESGMRRGVLEARRGLGSQQGRRRGQGGTENETLFFLWFFFSFCSF